MPLIVATIIPKPDQADAVEAVVTELIPGVHEEDGCELYALHRGKDRFVLVEKWRDMDALAAHAAGPGLKALNERLADLVASPPEGAVVEAVPAGDRAKGAIGPS